MIKTKIKQTVQGWVTHNWRKLQGRTRQSRLWLAGAIIAGVLALCLAGGGVYAAFFGGAGTSDSLGSSPIQLQKGLVGYWKLDGNAHDSSSYGNNGTINGATPTTDREGKANSAYSFNGTGAYISATPNYSISAGTVSMWVNTASTQPTTNGDGWYLLAVPQASGAGSRIYVNTNASGTVITARLGSGVTIGSAGVTASNWHHVSITWSGTTAALYVDGQNETSTSSFNGLSLTGPVYMGAFTGGTQGFSGALDDVRLYNRAISAAEVTALYNEYDPGVKAASGENGLVGWWKMDGNGHDSSSNGLNATPTALTATTDREGRANSAYSFNGSTSCLSRGATGGLAITGPVSISAWIYPTGSSSTYQSIVRSGLNADEDYGIFYSGTSHYVGFAWWDGAFKSAGITPTNSVPLNTWSHIVYTRDASNNLGVYVNGVLLGTFTVTTPTVSAAGFDIGATLCNSNQQFTGSIDDVRIYNRALSATEVANLYGSYNSQVSVSNLQAGLVGHWAFNGNAHDSSSYGNQGTVNGATLTTDREGRANSAYSFDGSSQYITLPSSPQTNSETVTVSAWIQTTGSAATESIIEKWGSGGVGYPYVLREGYGGKIIFAAYDGTHNPALTSSSYINDGKWHMITGTRVKGGTMALYIDGSLNATATDTTTVSTTNTSPVGIGSRGATGSYLFPGSIDDVRIYNRALSATEVQQLYNEYQ